MAGGLLKLKEGTKAAYGGTYVRTGLLVTKREVIRIHRCKVGLVGSDFTGFHRG